MKYPSYRDFVEATKNFTEEQLNQTITVLDLDCDQYFPCNGISVAREADRVLDKDHIVLVINADVE